MKRLGLILIVAASLQMTAPCLAETQLELSHSRIEKVIAYQGQGIVSRHAEMNLSSVGNYK